MWVPAAALVLPLIGCGERTVVVRERHPREVVVAEEPGYVVVQEAPPAVIVERRSAAPGVGFIWIDGYWHWGGHRYDWERGHWARPPHEHEVWIAPRYESHDRGGYRYVPGRWGERPREAVREPERGRPPERGHAPDRGREGHER